jgi:hypothetical protein
MNVPLDLRPYLESTYISGFPICEYCGVEPSVVSDAVKHSDLWYLDAAMAMKTEQWVIPEVQAAACPSCAAARSLRHNAKAFSSGFFDDW